MTTRLFTTPATPGWYILRDGRGNKIDAGENMAALCIRARNLGAYSSVEEVQHPKHSGTPFGFLYCVEPRDVPAFA